MADVRITDLPLLTRKLADTDVFALDALNGRTFKVDFETLKDAAGGGGGGGEWATYETTVTVVTG